MITKTFRFAYTFNIIKKRTHLEKLHFNCKILFSINYFASFKNRGLFLLVFQIVNFSTFEIQREYFKGSR